MWSLELQQNIFSNLHKIPVYSVYHLETLGYSGTDFGSYHPALMFSHPNYKLLRSYTFRSFLVQTTLLQISHPFLALNKAN